MTVLPVCPSCGMASTEVRCPRCNALKVVGCDGSCTLCRERCRKPGPLGPPPSRDAHEDDEHPGTPIEK